jgi:hypothetical protein
MSIQISDYINVKEKTSRLTGQIPTGIAILPQNFASAHSIDEFVYASPTSDIRSIWQEAGIIETPIEDEQSQILVELREDVHWWGPIIFVRYALFSENPHALSVTLNLISNYLYDHFKNSAHIPNSTLSIVIEDASGKSKKLDYTGPPSGIKELDQIVQELNK